MAHKLLPFALKLFTAAAVALPLHSTAFLLHQFSSSNLITGNLFLARVASQPVFLGRSGRETRGPDDQSRP
jgi:hypothetical protein